jgi:hypothetical protein
MAEHDEAQALGNAERRGERRADAKWESVVAEKDAALANKDAALANKDAENERLRQELAELRARFDDNK